MLREPSAVRSLDVADAAITLRRTTARGTVLQYSITAPASGGFELLQHRLTRSGWRLLAHRSNLSMEESLTACRPLNRIRTDEVNRIRAEDELIASLLTRLRVVEVGSSAATVDHELADLIDVEEGYLLQPACEVNDLPLVAFRFFASPNSAPSGLYSIDDERFSQTELLATSTWFSESGGAPISWSGGNRVERLPSGAIVSTQWGDAGSEVHVHCVRNGKGQLASFISDWVTSTESSISAALALEELKLPSEVSIEVAAAWRERLGIEMSFSLELPVQEVMAIRRRLRSSDPRYRAVMDGLARPESHCGHRLAAALDAVIEDGVLGHLREAELDHI